MIDRKTLEFARGHCDEDTARLLLSAARYPDIDMTAAVQQIEGLRTAHEKWPSLLEYPDYLYPPRLNREQASSEATAKYKVESGKWKVESVADLTGGMGIDTLAFAKVAEHVDYVERDPQLCALMEHNIRVLGIENITIHCADSMEWLRNTHEDSYTIIYIDPARRDSHGRKVSAFEECTPDILAHMALLRSRCQRLIIKASPMIDIDLACSQLKEVEAVHVVAAGGECKEVLFVCAASCVEPKICCGNHIFTRSDETDTECRICENVGRYLYEPDAAMMKAGPYRSICHWYGLEMLGKNTHLYTSNDIVDDFPGRQFEIIQELKMNRKAIAAILPDGKAHVVTRNYPVAAAELQRRLGLKEGGDMFIVATSVGSRLCGLLCKRI